MKLFGHQVNNWVVVGGAAGVGVVIFIYRRGSSSSSSAGTASSAAGTGTDPLTGLPYSEDNTVDPVTGMTYLQEAQQYGSVAAAEAAVSGGQSPYAYDPLGYGSGYGTSGYVGTAGYPSSGGGTTGTGGYASNAAWSQAVTAGLSQLGYNATDVAAALGLYFQSMPLTTASDGVSYLAIVQAAVAEFGPPPVGTYPIIPGGTGIGTGGGGGGTQVSVPDVVGQPQEAAFAILTAAGLHAAGTSVVPGKVLTVDSQSPAAGSKVAPGSTVTVKSSVHGASGGSTTVTVPNVIGQPQDAAYSVLSKAGLHPSGPAPVKGRVHIVTAESPKAGSKVARGSTVKLTSKIV